MTCEILLSDMYRADFLNHFTGMSYTRNFIYQLFTDCSVINDQYE